MSTLTPAFTARNEDIALQRLHAEPCEAGSASSSHDLADSCSPAEDANIRMHNIGKTPPKSVDRESESGIKSLKDLAVSECLETHELTSENLDDDDYEEEEGWSSTSDDESRYEYISTKTPQAGPVLGATAQMLLRIGLPSAVSTDRYEVSRREGSGVTFKTKGWDAKDTYGHSLKPPSNDRLFFNGCPPHRGNAEAFEDVPEGPARSKRIPRNNRTRASITSPRGMQRDDGNEIKDGASTWSQEVEKEFSFLRF